MTISAQAVKSDRVIEKISESKFRRNPIPLFVVVSVLVHGIGLVLFALIERSQTTAQLVPETAPIDFVIVPPEESASTTPTDPSPPEETPANQSIEPKPSTPDSIEAIALSPTVAVPEPVIESVPKEIKPPEEILAETPPQPEPPSQTVATPEPILESVPKEIKPPKEIKTETPPQPEPPSQTVVAPEPIPESLPQETQLTKLPKEIKTDTLPQPETATPPVTSNILTENQNSAEILTGSDATIAETETKQPEITKPEKISTNSTELENTLDNREQVTPLPPKIKPIQPLPTEQPLSTVTQPENDENNSVATPLPPKIKPLQSLPTEQSPSNVTQPENNENNSVATLLPPKITSPQSVETKPPAVPNQNLPANTPNSTSKTPTTTGAASLLGGNLKRSFEDDGGNSFFNLENNVSQQAYNPELNTQQRLDMRNYFAEIKRRVKRNWNPKYSLEDHTTVVSFAIQRNGQISFLKIRRTSGSQTVDREALEAVQKSGPFDPLPTNYPSEMLNVEFNFNIYIY